MDPANRINVTRDELYELVWSMPTSRACQTYGLSDVGLAKICLEWDIPRPPRGYWAKIRNGHRVHKRKLKPVEEGNPVVLSYRPMAPGTASELAAAEAQSASHRQRAFEKVTTNLIQVPQQLSEPHAVILKTEKSIRSARPDGEGIVRPKAAHCLTAC